MRSVSGIFNTDQQAFLQNIVLGTSFKYLSCHAAHQVHHWRFNATKENVWLLIYLNKKS